MSFKANFYKFTKKSKSTKRPSGTPAAYDCILLSSSGMVNPDITLNYGFASAPDYNYCVIPDFSRYYWVREWTFADGLWTASLTEDHMATYKTEIGSTPVYALRASSASLYDGSIVDNFYPTKTEPVVDSITVASPWQPLTDGCFVLGVVSKSADFGSLKYYICKPSILASIVSMLLDDNFMISNGFSINDAQLALQKSLIDPLQYIKSCTFIPIAYGDFWAGASESIKIFDWDLGAQISTKTVVQNKPYYETDLTFTITKHPQTASRGNYVNLSPYTTRQIMIPPFGVIPIDTVLTSDVASINANIRIDFPSGAGILTITAGGMILNRVEAQIGVPVQLSQVTQDVIGGISSIGGAILSAATAPFGVGIAGAASSIGDAVKSLMPRSQTVGHGGGYTQLTGDCKIEAQFMEVVDDDVSHNGRPCCQVVTPSVGGYFLIQDADIALPGTVEEIEAVRSDMESGFYYE